ncbi:tyrosine-type recombinase/integrase [Leifsonia sp. H3M29-4]|uniref:tyrosine-type recombinase/integrase n=1 Tax=Salinibacterium metalliresistens TaxID=3031321 RepID=UPI0023DC00B6|nr:tyrosine-type recombinase/integrase [Salinibacterium metalliresistens]MDF1477762.1 tyrosine-type recombinase/integrase [Salinibacterium metalliresistens]
MTVRDLWEDRTKTEIAELRAKGAPRYQRRWRGPDRDAQGRLRQHKKNYPESKRAEAYLHDAEHAGNPTKVAIVRGSLTVATLMSRHLAAIADRAPRTVEANEYHASKVVQQFGDRVVNTITPTEVEIWSQRPEVAAESRKKQLEILRAAVKRGVRDKLVAEDFTDGLVVSLRRKERPHYSSEHLNALVAAAPSAVDRAFLILMGFMGLREEEARELKVGDASGGQVTVRDPKTNAGRRTLPIPARGRATIESLTAGRPAGAYLFESRRKAGHPVAKGFVNNVLDRCVTIANRTRAEKITTYSSHALRHTFAAIALSEAGANLLAVSRALGHARPSITLDRYGHLAPAGLEPLMDQVDAFIDDFTDPVDVDEVEEDLDDEVDEDDEGDDEDAA